MTDTNQFILDHQSEIDEADFLSRYGRMNPDAREACVTEADAIWERLETMTECEE
jgi:hypothetical protein